MFSKMVIFNNILEFFYFLIYSAISNITKILFSINLSLILIINLNNYIFSHSNLLLCNPVKGDFNTH